ncbi:MAG: ChaN family lipoprotein [Rhodospirillales bacterium]|nr:ChaN family lipoprotein [Rhodospirillales bacterium]
MPLFPDQPFTAFKWLALVGALLILPGLAQAEKQDGEGIACVAPGRWQSPGDGFEIKQKNLLDEMAKRPVVMLGEAHTSGEHHRWQLHTLAALYSRNPNMVLGFEAFPRAVQPILDRWIRGELSEQKLIELSRWNDVWRYDSALYMPLFNFARMHRIPMRALNVERGLIAAISRDGWASIEAAQRAGLGDPLAPSKAYRESLTKVFAMHGDEDGKGKETPALSQADELRLTRFIEVQTIWDRAMAEAIAQVRTAGGKPLVVAIVGRGHVEYGFGIPHQLTDLGINNAAVLLPWDKGLACEQLKTDGGLSVADAVFGVDEPLTPSRPAHPMLGVQIENTEKGVRVIKVVDGSVAASTGLKAGDIIVGAAGVKVTKTLELVTTIRAMNPGTWLPLIILRDDNRLDVVAKFPVHP